jgi:hypothetical protein
VTPCQSQAVLALPIGRFDASPLSRPSSLVPPSLAGESPTPRFNSAGCLPLPPPHRKSRLLPPSSLSSTSTISWPAAALPSQRACFSPHSPTAPLQSDLSPLLPATADGDPSAPSLPPPLQEDRSSSSPIKLYLLLPPGLELMQICAITVWSRRCGVEDIDRNCGLHT